MTTTPRIPLTPTGGSCYGHLFENPHTGLARDLYWSFTVNFAPVDIDGDSYTPSMTVEWLARAPLKHWTELVGTSWSGDYGTDGAEATVYLWAHHPAERFTLEVNDWRPGAEGGVELQVRMVQHADLSDYDGPGNLLAAARTWLRFDGVVAQLDGVTDLDAALAPFLEPSCLQSEGRWLRPLAP